MTDDTLPEDPDSPAEPIDADFEPAPDEGNGVRELLRSGPGWLGAVLLTLFAAGLGGVIGIAGARYLSPVSGVAGDPSSRLEALERQQTETGDQVSRLGQADASLKAETAALAMDVEAVNQRLDEAPATGRNDALVALTWRIEALEAVDTSGAASPQELGRAMAGIEARLEDLERTVEAAGREADRIDPARLADIEAEMETLRHELGSTQRAGSQQVETLTGLVEQMRQGEAEARNDAEAASKTAQIAQAVSAIEAASRRGEGFAPELRTLRALLPDETSLRALVPIAGRGVPTVAALQESFGPAKAAAIKAIPEEAGSGWAWLNRAFGDAVSVRKIDGDDTDPAVILSEAEQSVQSGSIDAALLTLAQIKGPPAEALADWTEQANRRITLETALEALQRRLIEGEP